MTKYFTHYQNIIKQYLIVYICRNVCLRTISNNYEGRYKVDRVGD